MKKSVKNTEKRILNRRAKFDYQLGDIFSVGIVLTGAETKALRLGHGHLQGAYVTVKDGELWLINATVHGTSGVNIDEADQTRTRKLLAKQSEIKKLIGLKDQGLTIVPLEISTSGRYIKLKISVGKGRRQYDKRTALKAKEQKRKIESAVKTNLKE
jgi:SsrA-binding protein